MSNPTGSSIERASNCAASYALGQARSTGEDAIKGTSNHSDIEEEIVAGDPSKHVVVREALEGGLQVFVEEAYAIDVETEKVRRLGERLGRRYGKLGDNEIALTLDVRVVKANSSWIWDWKSRKRVASAAKNLQLTAAAVAVMKYEQLNQVYGGIGYLDNNEADTNCFDSFDVPVFFEDMRAMLKRIKAARELVASGGTPDVHSGPWCTYCPAIPYCPAHNRLAMMMIGELDFAEKRLAFWTPEQAGKAWELLGRIYALADKVEASIKLRARTEVIPLADGKKRLALVQSSRSNFNKEKAKEWIKEHGGDLKEFEGRTFYDQIREVNIKESA